MTKKKYTVEELINDKSFINYLVDRDSPKGKSWKLRLANDAELAVLAEEAFNLLHSVRYQDLSFSSNEQDQLWSRIDQLTANDPDIKPVWNFRYWMKIAAVLLPILISTIWLLSDTQQTQSNAEVANSEIVKECSFGRKMVVTLPDGSTVKLNSGSRLTYSNSFDKDVRVVWLEGEGFFDVKRNPEKPFIIISGNIRTQVLGTSFNVKSYKDEESVDVAVSTGLVSVSRFNESNQDALQWDNISGVVLNPSELVTYNIKEDQFTDISTIDIEDLLAWKSGILVFKQASFTEIVTRLERWYGVEFEIEKQVEIPDGFTGRFNNQSLRRVLEGIAYTSKFDFEIEGKSVKVMEMKKVE